MEMVLARILQQVVSLDVERASPWTKSIAQLVLHLKDFAMLKMLFVCLHSFLLLCIVCSKASGGFVVNMTEVGNSVVATGNGTINTSALISAQLVVVGSFQGYAGPIDGELALGTTQSLSLDGYYNGIFGPTNFGSGPGASASSSSGDVFVYLQSITSSPVGGPILILPSGYSGTSLSSQSIWAGQSFATLGVTPGTYTWSWGSGANADFYTLNAEITAVPEPGSIALVAIGAIVAVGMRKFKRGRLQRKHP